MIHGKGIATRAVIVCALLCAKRLQVCVCLLKILTVRFANDTSSSPAQIIRSVNSLFPFLDADEFGMNRRSSDLNAQCIQQKRRSW